MSESNRYRLGRSVLPVRYELALSTDLTNSRFEGEEVITIEVAETTGTIVLNAVELEIRAGWLTAGSERIEITGFNLDEETERLSLPLASSVGPGTFRLHLEFAGTLNDRLRGFYRSQYTDAAGQVRRLATTQFEATDARRAFPCFDEPEMKAVFAVTLNVEPGLLAVSNSPAVSATTDASGRRRVVFADTIRMSTYLLAFVVGPLEATEPVDAGGTPVRVVHPAGQGHLTAYAIDVARFSLQFFADYYGIPYPGQKVDLIALPDFSAGAMENFGCITFRETLLLVDPDTVTQGELRGAAMVIAHELAHMWFGDLVTMRWWNGIWLNEAFATFMEVAAVAAYRPEWRMWAHFSLSRSAAFQVDSLEHTRPIEYPVESPQDAEGMFDVLTYEKGASILRMLEQYLGPEEFRRGIHAYLKKHSYGNTETSDLWAAIEAATGQPVERIMTSWIYQGGFPRVRIELAEDARSLRLAQSRFRFSEDGKSEGPLWMVPVVLRIGERKDSGSRRRLLLEEEAAEIPFESDSAVVVGNVEANGFYRVRYADSLLEQLTARLFEALAPIERFALLDDAWATLLAGESEAAAFLALSEEFVEENDVDVWQTLCGCLAHLTRLVEEPPLAALQKRVARLVGAPLQRIGWDARSTEPEPVKDLRGKLVRTLCVAAADEAALKKARAVHELSYADPSSVEPNLAAAVLDAVASTGSAANHARFVERSKSASTPQERLRYLYALSSFPGADEMTKTLEMTLNGEVRTQDAPYLLASCLRNRFNAGLVWSFIRRNWEKINSTFPPSSIVRMLSGLRALTDRSTAEDVEKFFTGNPVTHGKLMLAQHLELMRVNVALREREEKRFGDSLTSVQAAR